MTSSAADAVHTSIGVVNALYYRIRADREGWQAQDMVIHYKICTQKSNCFAASGDRRSMTFERVGSWRMDVVRGRGLEEG